MESLCAKPNKKLHHMHLKQNQVNMKLIMLISQFFLMGSLSVLSQFHWATCSGNWLLYLTSLERLCLHLFALNRGCHHETPLSSCTMSGFCPHATRQCNSLENGWTDVQRNHSIRHSEQYTRDGGMLAEFVPKRICGEKNIGQNAQTQISLLRFMQ